MQGVIKIKNLGLEENSSVSKVFALQGEFNPQHCVNKELDMVVCTCNSSPKA